MKRILALAAMSLTLAVIAPQVAGASSDTKWSCKATVYYLDGQHSLISANNVTAPASSSARAVLAAWEKGVKLEVTDVKRITGFSCKRL